VKARTKSLHAAAFFASLLPIALWAAAGHAADATGGGSDTGAFERALAHGTLGALGAS
jgi:hypothetical protein